VAVITLGVALLVPITAPAGAARGKPDKKSGPEEKFAGSLLTTYWDTSEASTKNGSGAGDNLIRVLNPVGCPNLLLSPQCGAQPAFGRLCAMIYVLDDQGNMGECCGCPVVPQTYLGLSLTKDLKSAWVLKGGPNANPNSGMIDIVSASPNAASSCSAAHGCFGGCDPTSAPGYTPHRGLKGYVLHNQSIVSISGTTAGIPEVPLETSNPEENDGLTVNYLQAECASVAFAGAGSSGICSCGPTVDGAP
jgi:hypothetical protein